jgi:hypothetical protein
MTPRTKEILLKNDAVGGYERPPKFKRKVLKAQVLQLVAALQEHFKVAFTIDDQVQDASFFWDIMIPKELAIHPHTDLGYAIRISNFGRLATVTFQEEYSEATYLAFQNLIAQNGFEFLDAWELEDPYDGQWNDFKVVVGSRIGTWFHRFFDYL